jgi:glycosyltransferase involved in cell wall biosynthesis
VAAATALEEWTYRHTAAIAVPTEGMVRLLEARPAARGRAVHMPPAVDLERFAGDPAAPDAPPLRVLYAGTVGLAHGLGTLVTAARLAGPKVVELTIAGGGAEAAELRSRVEAERIGNVALVGVVASDEIPALLQATHAGVVVLRDRDLFADALPTKLLECLAAARPAVVSARGEAAALVRAAGAGLDVAPEDPAALADAFVRLAADRTLRERMGAAGRALVTARFARGGSVDRWAELLECVAVRSPQRARR